MSKNTYSLVIPAYNEEKYIGDCLEYALRQKDFSEIIVIDNASTDGTKNSLKRLLRNTHTLSGACE